MSHFNNDVFIRGFRVINSVLIFTDKDVAEISDKTKTATLSKKI